MAKSLHISKHSNVDTILYKCHTSETSSPMAQIVHIILGDQVPFRRKTV